MPNTSRRRPTPPSTPTSTRRRPRASSRTRSSCASRASRRIPAHADDCRAAADWLADALTAAGLEHVEVAETGGHPVVYADWLHAPDAPTVIVYGHYDVQPVDPLELWTSPPFEPVVVGDRMLARGAADDKGQIHAHVMAAAAPARDPRRAAGQRQLRLRGRGGIDARSTSTPGSRPTATGSPADVAIISDTGFFEGNIPAITLSLRGIMYAQIDVVGTAVDLHSGGYGGAVQNPANALAQIIAGLRARTAGSASRASTTTSSRCPTTIARRSPRCRSTRTSYLARARRCRRSSARPASRPSSARATRPTLDVNGIWGGFRAREQDDHPGPRPRQGQLPARGGPGPRHDLRGVPRLRRRDRAARRDDERPATSAAGMPSLTPIDHPGDAGRRAGARGDLRPAAGLHPRGRLDPGLRQLLDRILGLPVVLLGFTPPDDNAHAPNEWMDLGNYETGIRTFARMFDELVDLPR